MKLTNIICHNRQYLDKMKLATLKIILAQKLIKENYAVKN